MQFPSFLKNFDRSPPIINIKRCPKKSIFAILCCDSIKISKFSNDYLNPWETLFSYEIKDEIFPEKILPNNSWIIWLNEEKIVFGIQTKLFFLNIVSNTLNIVNRLMFEKSITSKFSFGSLLGLCFDNYQIHIYNSNGNLEKIIDLFSKFQENISLIQSIDPSFQLEHTSLTDISFYQPNIFFCLFNGIPTQISFNKNFSDIKIKYMHHSNVISYSYGPTIQSSAFIIKKQQEPNLFSFSLEFPDLSSSKLFDRSNISNRIKFFKWMPSRCCYIIVLSTGFLILCDHFNDNIHKFYVPELLDVNCVDIDSNDLNLFFINSRNNLQILEIGKFSYPFFYSSSKLYNNSFQPIISTNILFKYFSYTTIQDYNHKIINEKKPRIALANEHLFAVVQMNNSIDDRKESLNTINVPNELFSSFYPNQTIQNIIFFNGLLLIFSKTEKIETIKKQDSSILCNVYDINGKQFFGSFPFPHVPLMVSAYDEHDILCVGSCSMYTKIQILNQHPKIMNESSNGKIYSIYAIAKNNSSNEILFYFSLETQRTLIQIRNLFSTLSYGVVILYYNGNINFHEKKTIESDRIMEAYYIPESEIIIFQTKIDYSIFLSHKRIDVDNIFHFLNHESAITMNPNKIIEFHIIEDIKNALLYEPYAGPILADICGEEPTFMNLYTFLLEKNENLRISNLNFLVSGLVFVFDETDNLKNYCDFLNQIDSSKEAKIITELYHVNKKVDQSENYQSDFIFILKNCQKYIIWARFFKELNEEIQIMVILYLNIGALIELINTLNTSKEFQNVQFISKLSSQLISNSKFFILFYILNEIGADFCSICSNEENKRKILDLPFEKCIEIGYNSRNDYCQIIGKQKFEELCIFLGSTFQIIGMTDLAVGFFSVSGEKGKRKVEAICEIDESMKEKIFTYFSPK